MHNMDQSIVRAEESPKEIHQEVGNNPNINNLPEPRDKSQQETVVLLVDQ